MIRKAHNALRPISQKCPQCHLWNSCSVRLIDDGPLSLFQERSSSASSFHASLLQAVNGVMSLPQYFNQSIFYVCSHRGDIRHTHKVLAFEHTVVSQAPQHLRLSTKQATIEGCFTRQYICSVVSLHSGMSRAVCPHEFLKVDVDHWYIAVWALRFCGKSCTRVGDVKLAKSLWFWAPSQHWPQQEH